MYHDVLLCKTVEAPRQSRQARPQEGPQEHDPQQEQVRCDHEKHVAQDGSPQKKRACQSHERPQGTMHVK